jgi:hypothetical protein
MADDLNHDDHQVETKHIHAMLVKSPKALVDPYAASMQVIRGALAFALNHREQMTEWNYETILSLRLNLYHAGGMGVPVKDKKGVYL